MPNALLIWWSALCAVSMLNVAVWVLAARVIGRRSASMPESVRQRRQRLLWLSAIYVLGCAFRSAFPMVDVPRMCLHDSWLSRIVVGRSVATIAELCFAAQWALLLHEAVVTTGRAVVMPVSRALVPLIAVAEVLSWYSVLTASHFLQAVENSLWTLGAVLTLAAFLSLLPYLDDRSRRFLAAASVCGAVYVAFMVTADLPMYLSRWRADLAAGHQDLMLLEGMRTVLQRCRVVRDWTAWRGDVPWLSLYYTVAVWISVALAVVPPLTPARQPIRAKQASRIP